MFPCLVYQRAKQFEISLINSRFSRKKYKSRKPRSFYELQLTQHCEKYNLATQSNNTLILHIFRQKYFWLVSENLCSKDKESFHLAWVVIYRTTWATFYTKAWKIKKSLPPKKKSLCCAKSNFIALVLQNFLYILIFQETEIQKKRSLYFKKQKPLKASYISENVAFKPKLKK